MDYWTIQSGSHYDNEHSEHLCYIISQGFHLTDEQAYRVLIDIPAFACSHCGRKAHNARNLCHPSEL